MQHTHTATAPALLILYCRTIESAPASRVSSIILCVTVNNLRSLSPPSSHSFDVARRVHSLFFFPPSFSLFWNLTTRPLKIKIHHSSRRGVRSLVFCFACYFVQPSGTLSAVHIVFIFVSYSSQLHAGQKGGDTKGRESEEFQTSLPCFEIAEIKLALAICP